MDNLLHKLCEKSEAELWEMVKVEQWTPEHAKITYYLTEIMKGVKKMEHLKLVQEAMKRAEEMGEEGMDHMMGREPEMSHYARRGGGRRMGGRGRGRYNYAYFDTDEGENYTRGGNSSGGRGSGGQGGNYGYDYGYDETCPPYMTDPRMMPPMIPPVMYEGYMNHKINEKIEKEWEKEEKRRDKEEQRIKEKEKEMREREKERENSMPPNRVPPPPK